jgi:predicted lipoprotein with Yx(FWY)xxD motif
MTHHRMLLATSLGVAAVAAAGCGAAASGNGTTAASSGMKPASQSAATTVTTAKTPVGTVVVGGDGRTLYMFAKDTGPKSTCSGACATDWPPLTASSKPAAGIGVTASALSLVKRGDGSRQVVLNGHPLYFFSGDQAAGQVNGQGVDAFGAKWFTVSPSGGRITVSAPSGGTSTTRGGYGY